jgi:hypothetical protein
MYTNRFVLNIQLKRYIFFVITILFVFLPLFLIHRQSFVSHQSKPLHIYNHTPYERFCWQLDQRIELEQISNTSIVIDPSKESISYSYSKWRSSPFMPRLLTRCEHAIYMHLLSILKERVFRKYNIQYMMMAATLLGRYTSLHY